LSRQTEIVVRGALEDRIRDARGVPRIVLVSGEDCPNSFFEPSHESRSFGAAHHLALVAQPNAHPIFARASGVRDLPRLPRSRGLFASRILAILSHDYSPSRRGIVGRGIRGTTRSQACMRAEMAAARNHLGQHPLKLFGAATTADRTFLRRLTAATVSAGLIGFRLRSLRGRRYRNSHQTAASAYNSSLSGLM